MGKRFFKKPPPLFEAETFEGLLYRVYTPNVPDGEKVPLVLFLHGSGERGDDNKSQLKNAIKKVVNRKGNSPFMQAVVLAPQCPSAGYWPNIERPGAYLLSETTETETLKRVAKLVQSYRKQDFIDENRVYVVGLSMGGFATWELIARYPELFAAAVPICGGGPIDRAETLKEIPVYAFHGRQDPIVPYCASADTVSAIRAAGGRSVFFKTYERGRHNIWDKAIVFSGDERNPALGEWLFTQRKNEK